MSANPTSAALSCTTPIRGSSHHWSRQLQQFGHTVRLLPAHDVHWYVRLARGALGGPAGNYRPEASLSRVQ